MKCEKCLYLLIKKEFILCMQDKWQESDRLPNDDFEDCERHIEASPTETVEVFLSSSQVYKMTHYDKMTDNDTFAILEKEIFPHEADRAKASLSVILS